MRCAIRRLTFRGVPPAELRMARDSMDNHATTSRRAWDHPPPHASKTSGRKVAPRRQPGKLCPGRSACRIRPRQKRMLPGGVTEVRGTARIGGEPGFLQFWRNGSEFGDCRANDVADRIVTKNPVASTTSAQSVVLPTVEDLAAKPESGAAIPNRQAKTTLRQNMRVPGSRGPAGLEMETAGPGEGRVLEEFGNGLSLDRSCQTRTSGRLYRTRNRHWYQKGWRHRGHLRQQRDDTHHQGQRGAR